MVQLPGSGLPGNGGCDNPILKEKIENNLVGGKALRPYIIFNELFLDSTIWFSYL